jgi:chromosome segregation ATPase
MEDAKIETEEAAVLSVDDLIAKIGALTVEAMHLERKLSDERRSAQASIAAAMSAASAAKAEAEQSKSYKASHDALSVKHNELSAAYEKVRGELRDALKRIGELEATCKQQASRIVELEATGKQQASRIGELEATGKQQAAMIAAAQEDLHNEQSKNRAMASEIERLTAQIAEKSRRKRKEG